MHKNVEGSNTKMDGYNTHVTSRNNSRKIQRTNQLSHDRLYKWRPSTYGLVGSALLHKDLIKKPNEQDFFQEMSHYQQSINKQSLQHIYEFEKL